MISYIKKWQIKYLIISELFVDSFTTYMNRACDVTLGNLENCKGYEEIYLYGKEYDTYIKDVCAINCKSCEGNTYQSNVSYIFGRRTYFYTQCSWDKLCNGSQIYIERNRRCMDDCREDSICTQRQHQICSHYEKNYYLNEDLHSKSSAQCLHND